MGYYISEGRYLGGAATIKKLNKIIDSPEYVCRVLGGTMTPKDIAESLKKAKALLR